MAAPMHYIVQIDVTDNSREALDLPSKILAITLAAAGPGDGNPVIELRSTALKPLELWLAANGYEEAIEEWESVAGVGKVRRR